MALVTIPDHVWLAACQIANVFYPVTQKEKDDKTVVLEEWQRYMQRSAVEKGAASK